MNTEAEIANLWAWAAKTSARLSAIDAVITALTSQRGDDAQYLAALTAVKSSVESEQLNSNKLTDEFISEFQNHLVSLNPPALHAKLR